MEMTQAELNWRSTDTRASGWANWRVHLLVLTILIGLTSVLNWPLVVAAINVWIISPTYSHCFLIIPVSAFFIWRRRLALSQMIPTAYLPALILALPLVLIQILGALASITELQQLAFVGLVEVLILSILGKAVFTEILFPILFLIFLVPMGEYLIGPMQRFTTLFISAGLDTVGILHHTEGNIIALVNGRFRVAEACAGLRFLIATIAVGSLFAYITYSKWYKILLYMVACAIVPVIGNGFRALGIVLLAHYSNNEIATGADHLVYGWIFSVLILFVLMFVGLRFADPVSLEARSFKSDLPSENSIQSKGLFLTTAIALLAIAIGPALLYWSDHREIPFEKSALSMPMPTNGWSFATVSNSWQPDFVAPDARLVFGMREKQSLGPKVNVIIDYYAKSRNGHGLISSTNKLWDEERWHMLTDNDVHTFLDGNPVTFKEMTLVSHNGEAELVWWSFWANGDFTTSSMSVKLAALRSAAGGPQGSALFAISTIVDSNEDVARQRLGKALQAIGTVPAQLRTAAGIPAIKQ